MGNDRIFGNKEPLALSLLNAYGSPSGETARTKLSDQDVDKLYKLGLALLVYQCVETGQVTVSDDKLEELISADLTARVVHGQLSTVLEDVLTIAEERSFPVLLLKGIANAADLYLHPHHRTMGDIDVLVRPEDSARLYQELVETGYEPLYPDRGLIWQEGHKHLNPLKHPESGVPVDIHTALLSGTVNDPGQVFELSSIWSHTVQAEFRGMPCLRLSPEIDLLYTIAHWAEDPRRTSNATGICDIARMLQLRETACDWDQLRTWLGESSLLSNYFAVIIDMLARANVAATPAAVQDIVARSLEQIGKTNLRILQRLLNSFTLTGRERLAGVIRPWHAIVIWDSLLEPGDRSGRRLRAASRILNLGRKPGESLFSSLQRRLQRRGDS